MQSYKAIVYCACIAMIIAVVVIADIISMWLAMIFIAAFAIIIGRLIYGVVRK